jgi:NAD(P)H dehydrogenase (quinone)
MSSKIQIIFHSMYGHIWQLAEAIAEGSREVGATVEMFQVPETLPAEVVSKMGATDSKKTFAHIPIATVQKLAEADAIILGSPTRYGAATAEMRAFLDSTGSLWTSGALIGKVGSSFTSTASQHGGQETTLFSLSTFFFHMGMLVAGVPYSARALLNVEEVSGGSPYGASTVAGARGERHITANEREVARAQGRHVALIASKLSAETR